MITRLTTPAGNTQMVSVEYFQALIQKNGGLPAGWEYEFIDDNPDKVLK
jgi:hypothetical protein